jgi:hypothetical protein
MVPIHQPLSQLPFRSASHSQINEALPNGAGLNLKPQSQPIGEIAWGAVGRSLELGLTIASNQYICIESRHQAKRSRESVAWMSHRYLIIFPSCNWQRF